MTNRWTSAFVVTLLTLVAAGAPLYAQEEKSPLAVVEELEAAITDADASWQDKWKAYTAAKAAIAAEAEAGGATPASDRYAEIQAAVADALRRDTLPATGWVMGFFAASLLWGGFAVCLAIARKSGKTDDPEAE